MKKRLVFLSLYALLSVNCFADNGGVLSVSNEFPADKLMQENHTYINAAVFENLGVYDGSVIAIAEYEPTSRNCDAGYYLPKESDTCELCLENHYCGGGQYTYSETIAQGISDCPEGLVSPSGTAQVGLCGKIMHVGDDIMYLTSIKQTTPALNVRIDDTVYYAKMTPLSNGEKPINKNTEHSLHTVVDGVEYTIYDNTVVDE